VTDKRRFPRASLELECTLRRRTGSAITGHTVDVGPGGMRVCTARPLAVDEVLMFELPPSLTGHARVLRQQGWDTYAVRFEQLEASVQAELERIASRTMV
jgi:hypothetical protein